MKARLERRTSSDIELCEIEVLGAIVFQRRVTASGEPAEMKEQCWDRATAEARAAERIAELRKDGWSEPAKRETWSEDLLTEATVTDYVRDSAAVERTEQAIAARLKASVTFSRDYGWFDRLAATLSRAGFMTLAQLDKSLAIEEGVVATTAARFLTGTRPQAGISLRILSYIRVAEAQSLDALTDFLLDGGVGSRAAPMAAKRLFKILADIDSKRWPTVPRSGRRSARDIAHLVGELPVDYVAFLQGPVPAGAKPIFLRTYVELRGARSLLRQWIPKEVANEVLEEDGLDVAKLLPVAMEDDITDANCFVLSLAGPTRGQIFLWRHDECGVFNPVASDWTTFLASLSAPTP